jgi:hypothetical protein
VAAIIADQIELSALNVGEAAQTWPQHAMTRSALVMIWACLAAAVPAAAGDRLAGCVHVLDGDTAVVDGIHVRLKGTALHGARVGTGRAIAPFGCPCKLGCPRSWG